MTQKMKKGLSLLLAGATVFTLSSCAKGGEMSQKELEQKRAAKLMKLSNVYSMQYLKTDKDAGSNNSIERVTAVDGQYYFTSYYWKEIKGATEDETTYENGYSLMKLNEENGSVDVVRIFKNSNNYDEANSTADYDSVNAILPMKDGSVWYMYSRSHSDWSDEENNIYESTIDLVHEDSTGSEITRVNVDTLFDDEDNKYVDNMFVDKAGNLALQTYNKIFVVDGEGKLIKKVEMFGENDNQYVNSITATPEGEILALVVTYGENDSSRMLKKLDLDTGKFEDLFDCKDYADLYSFYAGENNTIYYTTTSGIQELNLSTGENKEVLNYINSDINGNRANITGYIGNKRFICTEYDSKYENQRTAILSPVSDGDAVEKYVLDFAAVYLNSNLQDAIIDFNKQNTDYRIRFIDYSKYNSDNDWEAGTTKLNNDIISGNIPDMFSLEGLPLENYVSKNLIADLKKYMDSDADFNPADYYENILNATAQDGKIYSIITSYYLNCLISAKDYFGGKTTISMQDFLNVRKQNPDAMVFAPSNTRSDLLTGYAGGYIIINEFLKANGGYGAFDSDDFAGWLEIVKEFPEEVNWDEYQNLMDSGNGDGEREMYQNGKILFAMQNISSFNQFRYVKRTYGQDYVLTGFPAPEGGGSGVAINPSMEVAVSAKSPFREESWSFIKYLLSKDYQEQGYGLSIRKDVMEDKIAAALNPDEDYGFERSVMGGSYIAYDDAVAIPETEAVEETADTDDATDAVDETADTVDTADEKVVATDDVVIGGDISIDDGFIPYAGDMSEKEALKTTQADIDKILAMINAADTVVRTNKEVNKIIEEEAGAFFSGKKSAKDVCSIIQSRVTVYVTEDK